MSPCLSNYCLEEPYPAVVDIRPDPCIVRQLLVAYAGPMGALTAMLQYQYCSLAAPCETALGDLFACVSAVKQQHIRRLGELIFAYGGEARLQACGRRGCLSFWNGSYIDYSKEPSAMLFAALLLEREAVAVLGRLMACVQGCSTHMLLSRLVADNERHIALFTDALGQFPPPEVRHRRRC